MSTETRRISRKRLFVSAMVTYLLERLACALSFGSACCWSYLLYAIGQRRVVERSREAWPSVTMYWTKFLSASAWPCRTVFGNDEEGEGGDGISVAGAGGWVHDGLPRVLASWFSEAIDGGGCALRGRLHVVAGLILRCCDGKIILLGIGQLHVADGAGRLAKLAGDAFAALAAVAGGPVDLRALADLGCPVRADGGEIVVKIAVVPLLSARWTTDDPLFGRSTPGLSFLMTGSCQLLIVPRKMPASASGERCSGCFSSGRL